MFSAWARRVARDWLANATVDEVDPLRTSPVSSAEEVSLAGLLELRTEEKALRLAFTLE